MSLFPEVGITRGFVSRLSCSWSDWRAHADTILARHPIELVRLTTTPEPMSIRHTGTEYLVAFAWPENDPDHIESFRSISIGKATSRAFLSMAAIRWPGIEFESPPVAIEQPPPLWPDLPMRI